MLGLLTLATAEAAMLLWVACLLRHLQEGGAVAAAQLGDQELLGKQLFPYEKKVRRTPPSPPPSYSLPSSLLAQLLPPASPPLRWPPVDLRAAVTLLPRLVLASTTMDSLCDASEGPLFLPSVRWI